MVNFEKIKHSGKKDNFKKVKEFIKKFIIMVYRYMLKMYKKNIEISS